MSFDDDLERARKPLATAAAEENKEIDADIRASIRERDRSTSEWMRRIEASSPSLLHQRQIRLEVEMMIDTERMKLGLPPLTIGKKKRGRPVRAKHPLPRRDHDNFDTIEDLQKDHKKKHQFYYLQGCRVCYMREYLYFKNHPDERPVGVETAGTDEKGRVRASRIYQVGGDPEKYPFKA